MPDTELADAIKADAIAGIKRAESDGQVVESMSIKDRILADQYAQQQAASTGKKRGLRFTQLIRPGTA